MNAIYPFGYFGGKLSQLDNILPMLPQTPTYVEPFGGSAAILLNREPSSVEVYNDLDGDIPNFFRVLREQPEELIRRLELTPYSRQEFVEAINPPDTLTDLERARRFYVRHNQAFANVPVATPGRWGFVVSMSRRNMAGNVSGWQGNIANLMAVAQRLARVQIEWAPALEVIQRYDSDDTLIYADPPYVHSSREGASTDAYWHEMNDSQHAELAEALNKCRAKVAISGYGSTLYAELYAGWHKTVFAPTQIASSRNRNRAVRQEVLWTNYEPVHGVQLGLFA